MAPPLPGSESQVAPDGGWGWVIVLGSSVINLFTRSIEPSFGLLFGDVLKQLGVATTGAAFIMSARDATINFSGLGFGFSATATFIALNTYFVKRRGQAFGLAMAGTAVGFMAMPQIISRLLEDFGFHGTMLLMGALGLNALAGTALLQPVKWHVKRVAVEEQDLLDEQRKLASEHAAEPNLQGEKPTRLELPKNDSFSNSLNLQKQKSSSFLSIRCKNSSLASLPHLDLTNSTLDIPMEGIKKDACYKSHQYINHVESKEEESLGNNNENKAAKESKEDGCWQKFVNIMDLDLLQDPVFLNILFGLSMAYLAEINFKLVIPFFMANLGYTRQDTAQALSLMAVADIVARLLIPPIFDRLPYTRRNTLAFGLVFVMFARSVLAEQTSWTNLIITILIHGFFRGFALINFPLVVSEAVTKEKLPSAFGLFMVSKGIFVVVLGPLVGWIRDYTGSYSLCLHAQSAMIMVCVTSWTVEYFFTSRSKQKTSQSKEPS